jgi:hypothetical protein
VKEDYERAISWLPAIDNESFPRANILGLPSFFSFSNAQELIGS